LPASLVRARKSSPDPRLEPARPQIITADNGYQNPLPATRSLAMMHLAMHDAVNAAAPR
jgi:hypothetical protein